VISSDTFANGNAGSVELAARKLVMRAGEITSFISSDAEEGSQGNAGNVMVAADELIMRGASVIRSSTFGPGNAGNVTVTADRLLMEVTSDITSDVGPNSTGNAGTVMVNARELEVLDESTIGSNTAGTGDAGTIVIAADRLVLDGRSDQAVPRISSASTRRDEARAQGNAGDVIIRAHRIDVVRGGQISASTFADGRGGNLDLEAALLAISADGSLQATGIFSGSEGGPGADGGTVRVQADRLFVEDGGEIRGSTFGPGDAGSIDLRATDIILVSRGAEIASGTFEQSSGVAGDVTLRANSSILQGGGRISSSSRGRGAAGTVTISADTRLTLNRGQITTASSRAGGGEIIINVQDLIDAQDSRISATVAGGADPTAGNILIDPKILIIDGSQIQANAPRGVGGNVRIVADNILVAGGDFDALVEREDISATGGDPERAGTVVVTAPEVDLAGGLVVLESGFVDVARLRERCRARRDVGASSFTGVGRGGLPPSPDGPLGG
jgi:large exoprotein involved in heme utilization and adhesion